MMGEEELGELADDIMLNGLHQPIVLYQGQILDGRNRYQACELAGIESDCTEYEGDDPLGYVLSLNLHRRHLTASQRAALAAEIANMTQADAAHKTNYMLGRSGKIAEAISQTEAAEKLDVSERYVREAKKIQEESPEHFDKVKSGELSLQQAKRELRPEPISSNALVSQTDNLPAVAEPESPDGYRGKNSHDGNLANGIVATCHVCDQSYDGTKIKYCPYCYYTPDQRSDYLQAERQKRQEQDLLEELPAVKAEPKSDIVVEFAGKRINTLDDLMKVKTPDQELLDQFFELDLAVIKVRKLVTELSAHPSTKIRSILYGRDEITRTLSYQATSLGESAQFYRELSNGEKSTGSN
tara:strand:+ start:439 stop:1503 length:1065 start_codon:yes stop_codon:yes gene_type:complete